MRRESLRALVDKTLATVNTNFKTIDRLREHEESAMMKITQDKNKTDDINIFQSAHTPLFWREKRGEAWWYGFLVGTIYLDSIGIVLLKTSR